MVVSEKICQELQKAFAGADLVYISDVHLISAKHVHARTLEHVIRSCEGVQYVVLGGDIFDFFWADHLYFYRKTDFLWTALACVAAKGSKVIYLEGNHEFCLASGLGRMSLPVTVASCYEVRLQDPHACVTVRVSHGDLILPGFWYRRYLGVVRSWGVRMMVRAVLQIPRVVVLLERMGLYLSSVSRRRHHPRSDDADQDRTRKVQQYLPQSDEDIHIFGHFHGHMQRRWQDDQGRSRAFVCTDSWSQVPNALVLRRDDDGVHILRVEIAHNTVRCHGVMSWGPTEIGQ